MMDERVIAVPGEIIHDDDGSVLCVVAETISSNSIKTADQFRWIGRRPEIGAKIPEAVERFVKSRLNAVG